MIKLIENEKENNQVLFTTQTKLHKLQIVIHAKLSMDFDLKMLLLNTINLCLKELRTSSSKYLIARNIDNILTVLEGYTDE